MSKEMPLTELLTDSFSFTWKQLGVIVKVMILPFLIVSIGLLIVVAGVLDVEYLLSLSEIDWTETESFEALSEIMAGLFKTSIPVAIGVLFVAAMVLSLPLYGAYASLFRYIGLGEEPKSWFALRLDGPMWRTFFAFLISFLINLGIYAFAIGLAFLLNPEVGTAFQAIKEGVELESVTPLVSFFWQVIVFLLVPLIIVGGKLAPFPAASACENRLMLINSWTRTKGHFWTILGAYILLMIALTMLSVVIEMVSQIVTSFATIVGSFGAGAAIVIGLVGVVVLVVSLVYQFFSMGVVLAFQGNIYKQLWR